MNSDFIMIIAKHTGTKIEEEVVEKGSDTEKKLLKDAPLAMFPMLEIKPGQLLCDTQAIVHYIVKSSGKTALLGKSLQE